MGRNRKLIVSRQQKHKGGQYLTSAPVLSDPNTDILPGQKNSSNGKSEFTFTKSELLDSAMDLERRSWPVQIQADRNSLERRLDVFPSGFIYCVDLQTRQVVGLSTSMLLKASDLSKLRTWEDITSNGKISAHTSDGNILYVVSVGVDPELRGSGLGTKLLQAQIMLAKSWSADFIALCSRLPGLHRYEGTAVEYLEERRIKDGQSIDEDLRFYQKNRFEIHSLRLHAMEDDPESRNHGVLMYRRLTPKK